MKQDLESIVREYIDKSIHMSLATVSDNKPWVCEVHFVYDDDLNLYWRSEASRRHSQEIAANPRVAGNIIKQHQKGELPHGIYFEGTAEMIEDDAAINRVLPVFIDRQGVKASAGEDSKKPDGAKFYKVTVENWYTFGKFNGDKVEKSQLKWDGRQM